MFFRPRNQCLHTKNARTNRPRRLTIQQLDVRQLMAANAPSITPETATTQATSLLDSHVCLAERTAVSDNAILPTDGQMRAAFAESTRGLFESADRFHDVMRSSFGPTYDVNLAEQIREMAVDGRYDFLPTSRFVAPQVLSDAMGAYSADLSTILLSTDLLVDANQLRQVYIEEVGHHLDAQLNAVDTAGDEGEMFRRLVAGENLGEDQTASILADDDHGVVDIDGESTEVEHWGFIKSAINSVGGAVKSVGNSIADAAKSFARGLEKAVVGGLSNALQGNFRAAFNSVVDGGRMATFQSVNHLVNGAIDGVKNLADAHTHLLPGRLGDAAREVTESLANAANGAADATIQAANVITTAPAEIARDLASDLSELAKAMGTGNFEDALEKFVTAPWNVVRGGAGAVFDVAAINAHGIVDVLGNLGDGTIEALSDLNNDFARYAERLNVLGGPRELSQEERTFLSKVYGDEITGSVDFDLVRIYENNHISTRLGMDSHVVGNNIYLNQTIVDSSGQLTERGRHLLTHEMAHVWQSQNGGNDYIHDAVLGQIAHTMVGSNTYDYVHDFLSGTDFNDLNREQQAELIADIGEVAEQHFIHDATDPVQRQEMINVFTDALNLEHTGPLDPKISLSNKDFDRLIDIWQMVQSGEGLGTQAGVLQINAVAGEPAQAVTNSVTTNNVMQMPATTVEQLQHERITTLYALAQEAASQSIGDITFDPSTGVVTVTGGEFDDALGIHFRGNQIEVALKSGRSDGRSNLDSFQGEIHDVRSIIFNGLAGNDQLLMSQGRLSAGVTLGNIAIKFYAGEGDDVMRNRSTVQSIAHGGDGNDSFYGGSSRDYLYGDKGNDWLDGGAGADFLRGGDDDDTLLGQSGHDRLYGDNGDDRLFGGAGNDVMYGGTGNDLLQGYSGHDKLFGGLGSDSLYGESGNDYLNGGDEHSRHRDGQKDRLTGGSGSDQFEYDQHYGWIMKNGRWTQEAYNLDLIVDANGRASDRIVNRF